MRELTNVSDTMDWSVLHSDIFACIPFYDARTICRSLSVNKHWNRSIKKHAILNKILYEHMIRIPHISRIGFEMNSGYTTNCQFHRLPVEDGFRTITAILFSQHKYDNFNVNIFDIFDTYESHSLVNYITDDVTRDVFSLVHLSPDDTNTKDRLIRFSHELERIFLATFDWRTIVYPPTTVSNNKDNNCNNSSGTKTLVQLRKCGVVPRQYELPMLFPGLALIWRFKNYVDPKVNQVVSRLMTRIIDDRDLFMVGEVRKLLTRIA